MWFGSCKFSCYLIVQVEMSFSLDMRQRWMRVRDNWWGDYHDPPKSYRESSIGSLTAVWQLSSNAFRMILWLMIHPKKVAVVIKPDGS